ncbi:Hypothetical protein FKW44_007404 [Caligus rogercresseyi]|uniref:Uncharacterized protein n=1 Tax=Caligus rogercresseyi TaxID=217165 RepID=A0A7T8QTJ4_CALRO|nr:Hypothetical protein FKW44_007404 [Caligus rogercresseyi]
MNNIITEYKSKLTTKNAANFLTTPTNQWDPLPYVNTWLAKGRRAAHSTSGMARQHPEEDNYFSPVWNLFKYLFGWRESTILHVAWLTSNLKMTTRPTWIYIYIFDSTILYFSGKLLIWNVF